MSSMVKWKIYNRRFLVDSFQLRLLAVAVTHFLLAVVIFVSVLFVPIIIRMDGGDLTSPSVQQAAHDFLVLHNRLWAPLLGAFVLLILHNIVVTHRIAGPLVRFRQFLKTIGQGDFSSPFRVRKNDYLHKEVDVTNEMVASLRSKASRLQEQLDQTSAAWAVLKSVLDDRATGDLQRQIGDVGEYLESCRASAAAFRTDNGLTPEAKTRPSSKVSLQPIGLKD